MNTSKPRTSRLAIASVICTVVCMPVGLVLAVVALIQISKAGKHNLGGQTLALVALGLSLTCIPVTGVLSAIAIPNFVRYQCRAMQSEAKVTLKSAYVAEQMFHGEKDRFGTFEEVDFRPIGASRYELEVVEAGSERLRLRAVSTGERMRRDVWEIDEHGTITNVEDGCR